VLWTTARATLGTGGIDSIYCHAPTEEEETRANAQLSAIISYVERQEEGYLFYPLIAIAREISSECVFFALWPPLHMKKTRFQSHPLLIDPIMGGVAFAKRQSGVPYFILHFATEPYRSWVFTTYNKILLSLLSVAISLTAVALCNIKCGKEIYCKDMNAIPVLLMLLS
jgi:hypothetical protein